MIPRRKKHISKPVDLFDPGAFYKDFHNETVVKARLAELEVLEMDEIQSERGWTGYELPECKWSSNWHPSHQVANYRAWPAEAHGWILQVKYEGNNTCMLRRKAVYEMPEREWEELMNKVRTLKDDYPTLDDDVQSKVESEYKNEEWESYYRGEFQKEMQEKFEDVFTTLEFGEKKQAIFDEMISSKELTDEFFYRHSRRCDDDDWWSEEEGGDWCLSLDKIIDKIDTNDVLMGLREMWKDRWPDDPNQLKFPFYDDVVESLVREMLNDDLMVMVDSPLADRIVDSLLEDQGPHSYSCVMINLPEDLANQIMAWGKLQVKDEDVI